MDQTRARVVALVTAALCCVAGMVVGMVAMPADALFIAGFVAYPVVGALILAKVPRHDIGRLMVGVGVGAGWAVAGVGVAASHATGPQVDAWLGLVESTRIVVGLLCLMLIFVLFPSPVVQTRGQRLSRLLPDSGALAVAGATLAAAAVFRPLLNRTKGAVDRRFNRAKSDAAQDVEAFAARLRDLVDPEAAAAGRVAVIQRSVKPSAVGLWIGGAR